MRSQATGAQTPAALLGVSDVGYIYVIYFWKPDISE